MLRNNIMLLTVAIIASHLGLVRAQYFGVSKNLTNNVCQGESEHGFVTSIVECTLLCNRDAVNADGQSKAVYNNESMICKCMTGCNETSVGGGGNEGDGAVTSEILFKVCISLHQNIILIYPFTDNNVGC